MRAPATAAANPRRAAADDDEIGAPYDGDPTGRLEDMIAIGHRRLLEWARLRMGHPVCDTFHLRNVRSSQETTPKKAAEKTEPTTIVA